MSGASPLCGGLRRVPRLLSSRSSRRSTCCSRCRSSAAPGPERRPARRRLAILVFLTAVNYVGLGRARAPERRDLVKMGSLVGPGRLGLASWRPHVTRRELLAPLPVGGGPLLAAFGVAMIAVLLELRRLVRGDQPGRRDAPARAGAPARADLGHPRGHLLYVLMNLVYVRALPSRRCRRRPRLAKPRPGAVRSHRGPARSARPCWSRPSAASPPRSCTPPASTCRWRRTACSSRPSPRSIPATGLRPRASWPRASGRSVLTFSGAYEQLYTYVVFAVVLFHAATGAAVLRAAADAPGRPRPYRTWGYPWVPLVFILSSLALVVNTLVEKPKESADRAAAPGPGSAGVRLLASGRAAAGRDPPRGAPCAPCSNGASVAIGTLLSRDIAVLTNAIAFNFLLCLFPLLLVLAGFSQRYQGSRAGAALLLLLQELIPFDQEAIAASLKSLTRIARGLEVFSLLLIVWGSSGIFMPVEMALNRAWGGRSERHFLVSRGLAFLMTVAGGCLAFVSVGLTVTARHHGKAWPLLAGFSAKASALPPDLLPVLPDLHADPVEVGRHPGRPARGALGRPHVGTRQVRLRRQARPDEPAGLLRPARLLGRAAAVGLRLQPGSRVRRADGARGRPLAAQVSFLSR